MLLTYFYQKLNLLANFVMQATSGEQNIVDIGLKVKVNQEIISSIAIPLRHITV